MPEMPEVEAVCRKLRPAVAGLTIERVQTWRCADPSVTRLAPGRRIEAVDRRAKHILIRLSGGHTLTVHLRMTGNLYAIPDARLHTAEARVVFTLSGESGMVYSDPRALGKLKVERTEAVDAAMAKLAAEPLGPAFTTASFVEMAKKSQQSAKIFLMDQRRVAGLGNIYAAEALYRAGIGPRRAVNGLSSARLARLHGEIVSILEDAVESASRAYAAPLGGGGGFSEAEDFPLAVYGREGEPCNGCGEPIRRIAQGGRSTYYCSRCQK
jgi:formamidopyrimidine-DNA glycosylase